MAASSSLRTFSGFLPPLLLQCRCLLRPLWPTVLTANGAALTANTWRSRPPDYDAGRREKWMAIIRVIPPNMSCRQPNPKAVRPSNGAPERGDDGGAAGNPVAKAVVWMRCQNIS